MRWGVVTCGLVLSACNGSGGPDQDSAAPSSGITVTATATATASATDTASSGIATDSNSSGATESADGSGPKFDIPEPPESDLPPSQEGCEKVDVLMSIDNSGSMQEEVDALQGPVFDSFPMQLLAINGGLLDFQLGVIDACNDPPYLHNWGDSGDCNFANGQNYMVSSNAALSAEYGCVTELNATGYNGMADGCSGSNDDEQPANTAADASLDLDGTNMGFVRADAIHFIVAITDEDEKPLPVQTAQEVADKIIAAKGGIENVVFLGIGGDSDCSGPYGNADEAFFLREITQIFVDANRGLWWDLCMGDLESAFAEVISVIDTACSEFEPEG